jgi:hypothetical protein
VEMEVAEASLSLLLFSAVIPRLTSSFTVIEGAVIAIRGDPDLLVVGTAGAGRGDALTRFSGTTGGLGVPTLTPSGSERVIAGDGDGDGDDDGDGLAALRSVLPLALFSLSEARRAGRGGIVGALSLVRLEGGGALGGVPPPSLPPPPLGDKSTGWSVLSDELLP